jgi:hypothetical protein
MKHVFAFFLLVSLVGCGRQRHTDEGVGGDPVVASVQKPVLVGQSAADASTVSVKSCNLDLVSSLSTDAASGAQSFRFSRFLSSECVGKNRNVILLVKYPAASFPHGASLSCVLIRTPQDIQLYGDFNFKCSGAGIAVPAGASTFFVDIPYVATVNLASIKMKLLVD